MTEAQAAAIIERLDRISGMLGALLELVAELVDTDPEPDADIPRYLNG